MTLLESPVTSCLKEEWIKLGLLIVHTSMDLEQELEKSRGNPTYGRSLDLTRRADNCANKKNNKYFFFVKYTPNLKVQHCHCTTLQCDRSGVRSSVFPCSDSILYFCISMKWHHPVMERGEREGWYARGRQRIVYIEVWENTNKLVPPPWRKCYSVMKVLKFM